jgi:hypothetical protein
VHALAVGRAGDERGGPVVGGIDARALGRRARGADEDAELVDRRDDLGVGGGRVGGDDRLELRERVGG